jgi:hypothetical protein
MIVIKGKSVSASALRGLVQASRERQASLDAAAASKRVPAEAPPSVATIVPAPLASTESVFEAPNRNVSLESYRFSVGRDRSTGLPSYLTLKFLSKTLAANAPLFPEKFEAIMTRPEAPGHTGSPIVFTRGKLNNYSGTAYPRAADHRWVKALPGLGADDNHQEFVVSFNDEGQPYAIGKIGSSRFAGERNLQHLGKLELLDPKA